MPSVFERYALGRRPAQGRGRGRSSPPKKAGKKKPQPAWNGYLTDSARDKLPLKEQERRRNNYNFCPRSNYNYINDDIGRVCTRLE